MFKNFPSTFKSPFILEPFLVLFHFLELMALLPVFLFLNTFGLWPWSKSWYMIGTWYKDVGRKSREMAVAVALSFRMYGGCKLYCRLQSWVIWWPGAVLLPHDRARCTQFEWRNQTNRCSWHKIRNFPVTQGYSYERFVQEKKRGGSQPGPKLKLRKSKLPYMG